MIHLMLSENLEQQPEARPEVASIEAGYTNNRCCKFYTGNDMIYIDNRKNKWWIKLPNRMASHQQIIPQPNYMIFHIGYITSGNM